MLTLSSCCINVKFRPWHRIKESQAQCINNLLLHATLCSRETSVVYGSLQIFIACTLSMNLSSVSRDGLWHVTAVTFPPRLRQRYRLWFMQHMPPCQMHPTHFCLWLCSTHTFTEQQSKVEACDAFGVVRYALHFKCQAPWLQPWGFIVLRRDLASLPTQSFLVCSMDILYGYCR